MRKLAFAIATWFYCGLVPFAPGTAGSLAAIIIAWLLSRYLGTPPLVIAALGVLLMIPGIWAADVVAKTSGKKDPQIVVVDEVVGQWMTFAGAASISWVNCLLAFALFRLFDIWKPPPVRRLEKLPGGVGIVADDAMAGVYAAIVLWLLNHYIVRQPVG